MATRVTSSKMSHLKKHSQRDSMRVSPRRLRHARRRNEDRAPGSTIGIVIRGDSGPAVSLAKRLIGWCSKNGLTPLLEASSAGALANASGVRNARALTHECDAIVALGGDGTLLSVARLVAEKSPPLVGVNFGKLGFLTEIAPTELFDVLPLVLRGEASIATRNMLRAFVVRAGKRVFSEQALNDVVVLKGPHDRLLELDVAANRDPVMRLRADGLIIATPTGSTAYSLAAGGTIVHPDIRAMVVTPLCPHSLTVRPLILPLASKLSISIPEYSGSVTLSIDGQASTSLSSGDRVEIEESPHVARLVESRDRSYFAILRTKLNWAIANH